MIGDGDWSIFNSQKDLSSSENDTKHLYFCPGNSNIPISARGSPQEIQVNYFEITKMAIYGSKFLHFEFRRHVILFRVHSNFSAFHHS